MIRKSLINIFLSTCLTFSMIPANAIDLQSLFFTDTEEPEIATEQEQSSSQEDVDTDEISQENTEVTDIKDKLEANENTIYEGENSVFVTDEDTTIKTAPVLLEDGANVDPYLSFVSPQTFTVSTDGNKTWNGTIEYSTDTENWNVWDGSKVSAAKSDDNYLLYFRGKNNTTISKTGIGYYPWAIQGSDVSCNGYIETLLDYAKLVEGNETTKFSSKCFIGMFEDCEALIKAPMFCATELAESCYESMFAGCSNLASSPNLPAVNLKKSCYASMFLACTSITTPTNLPAGVTDGTLAEECYKSMYNGCSSLEFCPSLSAKALEPYCYSHMFDGCNAITSCPDLPASQLASNCYLYMFTGCESLITPVDLSSVKTVASNSCEGMFYGCKNMAVMTAKQGVFNQEWKVQASEEVPNWSLDMFKGTSGSFTGSPQLGKSYYIYGESSEYFYFSANEPFSVAATLNANGTTKWDGTVEYSTDTVTWKIWNGSSASAAKIGTSDKYIIMFRGKNNTKITGDSSDLSVSTENWRATPTNPTSDSAIKCSGNIGQLIDYEKEPAEESVDVADYCFGNMFAGNVYLYDTPDLSSIKLSKGCFYGAFFGCLGLTTAPELTHKNLAELCYSYMFCDCTYITTSSDLTASTLANGCYEGMFRGCTRLTEVGRLSATELVQDCYKEMFYACISLTYPIDLDNVSKIEAGCCELMYAYCTNLYVFDTQTLTYVDKWNATRVSTEATDWSVDMFKETAGGFTGSPKAGLTYYTRKNIVPYLTLECDFPFEITVSGTFSNKMYYSQDKEIWLEIDKGKSTQISSNMIAQNVNVLYIRGEENDIVTGSVANAWSCNVINEKKEDIPEMQINGNIETLLDWKKVESRSAITMGEGCYAGLFKDFEYIKWGPDLPALNLTKSCYESMYEGCKNLWYPTALEATTLTDSCYKSMFKGCENLWTVLMYATTLAPNCCESMYEGCNSGDFYPLPLLATNTAPYCYQSMYKDCTSLTSTTLNYATDTAEGCYKSMYQGCTKLKNVAEFDNTQFAVGCCESMFEGCISLTKAASFEHYSTVTFSSGSFKAAYKGCTSLTTTFRLNCNDIPDYCFESCFENCTSIVNPTKIIMNKVGQYSCKSMYEGCTSLSSLGATSRSGIVFSKGSFKAMYKNCTGLHGTYLDLGTSLAESCCESMFEGCSYLFHIYGSIPIASAESCYKCMFKDCERLFEFPHLETQVLAPSCYESMFENCSSLEGTVENYMSVTAAYSCKSMYKGCYSLTIASDINVSKLAEGCFESMFENCVSIRKLPKLSSTGLVKNCYKSMFKNCLSVYEAPLDLSSIVSVEEGCCSCMFEGCKNLRVYERPTLLYGTKWRATNAQHVEGWANDMFKNTGGEFTGSPVASTDYYVKNDNEDYISFYSASPFSIEFTYENLWDGNLYYATTNKDWKTFSGKEKIEAEQDQEGRYCLFMRGKDNSHIIGLYRSDAHMSIEGENVRCMGNIETLLDWETVQNGEAPEMGNGAFNGLFAYNDSLISAPDLPAVSTTQFCYAYMFDYCKNLVECPCLNSSYVEDHAYFYMFRHCECLTRPADLSTVHYTGENACEGMYSGCINLYLNEEYSEDYPQEWIATKQDSESTGQNWNLNMFEMTKSSVVAPEAGKTYYIEQDLKVDSALSFVCNDKFTITLGKDTQTWNGTLYYSTNKKEWKTVVPGVAITSEFALEGEFRVYFAGLNNTIISNTDEPDWLIINTNKESSAVRCYGNTESILDYKVVGQGQHPTVSEGCFKGMFYSGDKKGSWKLTKAPDLGTTNLSKQCYANMFQNCINLVEAPVIEATTLDEYCCSSMFNGCTALTNPPELKATTLKPHCYEYMFYNNTSLTYNPELVATKLADYCYLGMFEQSGIRTINNIKAENAAEYSCQDMFVSCQELTEVQDINIKTTAKNCFQSMFYNCKNLTTVSDKLLSAPTVEEGAYTYMFYGCSSIKYAPNINAQKIGDASCSYMFAECNNMCNPPTLDCTQIGIYCFSNMFSGCINLAKTPNLPATDLPNGCYFSMFNKCESLMQPADMSHVESVSTSCCASMYADCYKMTVLTEPNDTTVEWKTPNVAEIGSWSLGMFHNTRGEVTEQVSLNTTYYVVMSDAVAVLYEDMCLSFKLQSIEESVLQNDPVHGNALEIYHDFQHESMSVSTIPWHRYSSQITSVEVADPIYSSSIASWFYGFTSCKKYDLNRLNTTYTFDMTATFMFTAATELDLSSFNTQSVTQANSMFAENEYLKTIKVSDKWSFNGATSSRLTGMYFPPRKADDYYFASWKVYDGDPALIGNVYNDSSEMPNNVNATYSWNERPAPEPDFFNFSAPESTYDKNTHEVSVSIKDDYIDRLGNIEKIEYLLEGQTEPSEEKPVNAGTYQVLISGKSGTEFHPYERLTAASWTLVINKASITNETVTILGYRDKYTYSGQPIEPDVFVYHNPLGELKKGTDYSIEYDDNLHASYFGSKARIIVHGLGNYKDDGNTYAEFEIQKATNVIYNFNIADFWYGNTPDPRATSYFGSVKFSYSKIKQTDYGAWNTDNQPGTYYCCAYVPPSEYFDYDYCEQVLEFHVLGDEITAQAIPATGLVYDGEEKDLGQINVDPTCGEYEIMYKSTPEGQYDTYDMPKAKSAGKHTVYYRISAKGCLDLEGTFDTVIAQKEITCSDVTAINKTYNASNNVSLNLDNAKLDNVLAEDVNDVKIERALGEALSADVGTQPVQITKIDLCGSKSSNYYCEQCTSTITVDIAKATPTLVLKDAPTVCYVGLTSGFTFKYTGDGKINAASSDVDKLTATVAKDFNIIKLTPNQICTTPITITVSTSNSKNYTETSEQVTIGEIKEGGEIKNVNEYPASGLKFNDTQQNLGYVTAEPDGCKFYYAVDGGSYGEEGKLPTAIEAGDHIVSYKITYETSPDAYGVFGVNIAKVDNEITDLSCPNIEYLSSPTPTANAKYGKDDIKYLYSSDQAGPFTEWDTSNLPGTYYVKAYVEETENYNYAEDVKSFSVTEKALDITFKRYDNLVYNAMPQLLAEAIINGEVEGVNIEYKIDSGEFSENKPYATNAGNYSVTYKATKPGYATKEETTSSPVIIAKADNKITSLQCESIKYKNSPKPVATSIYGNCDYLYSNSESGEYKLWDVNNTPGTYWVKAKVEETENYKYAEKIASFEVEPLSFSVKEIPSLSLIYNGQPQLLGKIEVNPSDSNVSYRINGGQYSTELPYATEGGQYTLGYKIEKVGYATLEQDFTNKIIINRAKNEISNLKCDDIYTQDSPQPSATAISGVPQYLYSKTQTGIFTKWDTSNEPGTYWVKAFVDRSQNYEYVEKLQSFTVKERKITVTEDPATGLLYNGQPQNLGNITTDPDDATIEYKLDPEAQYSTELPVATNAGSYKVYYRASKDTFPTVEGSFTVTIAKVTPTLNIDATATYIVDSSTTIDTQYNGESALNVTSSDPSKVTVSASGKIITVNALAVGEGVEITVTAPESANFNTITKTQFADVDYRSEYYITFESNGGTPIERQTVKTHQKVVKPNDPKLTGNTFEGWYTDSALTQKFDFDTPIVRDYTLYAKYNLGELVVVDDPDIIADKSALNTILTKLVKENPEAKAVTLSLNIEKGKPAVDDEAILKQALQDKDYIAHNITLTSTIDSVTEDLGSTNDTIIPITYKFDMSNKNNVNSLRVHNGVLQNMPSVPNPEGEYAIIDSLNNQVQVFAKKFSSYGFSFDKVETEDTNVSAAQTGDTIKLAGLGGLCGLSIGIVTMCFVAFRKRKHAKK